MTCRAIDNPKLLQNRCVDAASRTQGYIIVLTDADLVKMLKAKSRLEDEIVEDILHKKFGELLT